MNKSNKLLSEIVAYRTYAKHINALNRRESLEETINRNMVMFLDKYPKLSSDIVKAFKQVHDLKVMPSMRSLQFGGEAIHKNNVRLFNCSFANITYTRVFAESLYLLLSGTGFGYSVQRRHISQLPSLRMPKEENIFIVHDSIEGWADSLDALMNAYFYGAVRPLFDLSRIRSKGSYLVTTGAKAPGPAPLKHMLEKVESMLKNAIGRKLTSIEVHDIICVVSDCVLAGGIRRAALISLFDKNDDLMLKCKHGNWWEKHPYRARANNSAVLHRNETTYEEFKHVFDMCINSNAGEPGFFWTNDYDVATNPCCFVGSTLIKTDKGYERLDKLAGREVNLINKDNKVVKGKVWSSGVKDTLTITFENEDRITCTYDHRFMLHDGTECVAELLDDQIVKVFGEGGIKVKSIVTNPEPEEVFDFNLDDDTHWGVVSSNGVVGYVAHNCEISLRSNQFCNLSTVNLTGIKSDKDFHNRVYAASLLGTLQAGFTDFPYLSEKWRTVTEEEALIGVSFTGIADSANLSGDELQKAAKLVLEVNEKYARKIGTNLSARTTAIKPEGTASCVLGSSSGIHARHADYYLRRVRMNKDDELAMYLSRIIPDLVENDLFSSSGVVVTIPQESPKHAITRHSESAIDLFNRVKHYYNNWIIPGHRDGPNTHNVSCTINYKPEEVPELLSALWNDRNSYAGISLLPFSDAVYQQAPFEDCSKETFDKYEKLVKEIDLTKVMELEDKTNRSEQLACAGGVCELNL